jgi:hypothetical protein
VNLLCLQASAARAALEAEQALVSQLKEEASISAAASAQLMSIEQQVCGSAWIWLSCEAVEQGELCMGLSDADVAAPCSHQQLRLNGVKVVFYGLFFHCAASCKTSALLPGPSGTPKCSWRAVCQFPLHSMSPAGAGGSAILLILLPCLRALLIPLLTARLYRDTSCLLAGARGSTASC